MRLSGDARLSALHRGDFGPGAALASPDLRPDRLQRAPRARVVVPGGRGAEPPPRDVFCLRTTRYRRTRLKTAIAVAIPKASMSSSMGVPPAACATTWPPSCAAAAPIAIWMKPLTPDAAPPTCGRQIRVRRAQAGTP